MVAIHHKVSLNYKVIFLLRQKPHERVFEFRESNKINFHFPHHLTTTLTSIVGRLFLFPDPTHTQSITHHILERSAFNHLLCHP
jgi:hypothetical protein